MNDRELLELAAKAAGFYVCNDLEHLGLKDWGPELWVKTEKYGTYAAWNPLTDDGDALRLAVKLHMTVDTFVGGCEVGYDDMKGGQGYLSQDDGPEGELDDFELVRRAIVRAAAEMGRV